MKSKTTAIWFVLAAALFAGIWLSHKYLRPAAPGNPHLLAGLRASDVTAIDVSPAGTPEISAVRTNGVWLLEKPLSYPAQAAAIEALAGTLENLTPATRLTAAETHTHSSSEADFGFDNPQFRLNLDAGGHSWHLLIGNKTAPGDQVFIRVVGLDGAFVTDAGWLQLLPHSADEWRDTSLVNADGPVDWIVVTNSVKGITMEFRRDSTNSLWRMIRPLAARADGARIAAALQQLEDGRVARFVTDNPADLSGYGLQPAELDVWLGHGTNFITAVHAGKSLSENSPLLFARREGWNAVVTAGQDAFAPWRGAVNDFRDPHLLNLTMPVAEIDVSGGKGAFTLQKDASNQWAAAGEKFPVDAENVQNFLKLLTGLRISEFVKSGAVTATDLQGFGFTPPSREITLLGTAGDTNSVLAQLLFGTNEPDRVLVKRADEDFVYAIPAEDFYNMNALYGDAWEFRDRRIWNFSETNVAEVMLRENGRTRELLRTGANKWSLAPGSQGIITPPAIEETVHRLGGLAAYYWLGRNITDAEKNYGLSTNNLSITIQLKSGEKMSVAFGTEVPKAHTALAAVTLDGERWAFVFPPVLYQFVSTYMTIPPNGP
jgi:hypothetical protein